MQSQAQARVIHVPAGEGESVWVVGDTYTFKVTGAESNGSLLFWEAFVPPQAGPPPHIHLHEDEAYYVLEGEFEVLEEDHTFTAKTGSFVFIPRGVLHRFKNVSATPSRMVVLFTPAGFENFLREVGQPAEPGVPAPPPSPEELARSIVAAPKYGLELRSPPVSDITSSPNGDVKGVIR